MSTLRFFSNVICYHIVLPHLIICFHLDTFCFDANSYPVNEDDGVVVMTLTLSRALPFNISVKFLYEDRSANRKLMICCVICTVS